jgi:hypothetical protein
VEDFMEISIIEAFKELKLLDKRIEKIKNIPFISCRVRNKKIDNKISDEEFTKEAKSQFQSIKDLIKQRAKIKSLIVESNAKTLININEIHYSVSDAIERKNSIKYDKMLLDNLRKQYAKTKEFIEDKNYDMQEKLDDLLLKDFGKEQNNNGKNIDPISESYKNNNEWIIIDPLNILSEIEKLENEIYEFEENVNFKLAESNTITKIEI